MITKQVLNLQRITMEPDNSEWKKTVEKSFRSKDMEEKEKVKIKMKTTIDIPRERKGVFPTKKYEVEKHLESCPKQEVAGEEGDISSAAKMEIPPKIISGDYGRMMEFLGEQEISPKDFTEKAHEYPFSAVGMVVSRRASTNVVIGTGSLIGPNVVLTCAHNVFQANIKKDHTDIEFLPASIAREMKNGQYSGKGFRVKKAIVPSQYREMDYNSPDETNQGLLFDFAVLFLETDLNLEEYFGSFSYNFDWWESPWVKNIQIMKDLELIGFPRSYYSHKFSQFECSAISDTNFMLYSLSTFGGSSGSPLLLPHKNEPYTVFAVHVRDVSNLVLTNNKKIERKAALKLRADLLQQPGPTVKHTYGLGWNHINEKDVLQVVKEIDLHQLSQKPIRSQLNVYLWGNSIGAEGCRHLVQGKWEHLTTLGLWDNSIGAEGCRHLVQGKWGCLQKLHLQGNQIDATGCEHLAHAQHWRNSLKNLYLWNNKIGKVQGQKYFKDLSWSVRW